MRTMVKFKPRLVLTVICLGTLGLLLTSDQTSDCSERSITSVTVPRSRINVNLTGASGLRGLSQKNYTEKIYSKVDIKANKTGYPLSVKIGTLVKVAGEHGITVVEQRVADRYTLCRRIGGGTFGHIFLAIDKVNGECVAVKVDRFMEVNSTVSKEGKIYQILQGGEGFPTAKWRGREDSYNILVMDHLGPNLQTYFELCKYRFSLKTVLQLADQMIRRLEYVHYKGFIHRDISPVNFVVGLGGQKNTIYSIDFGLTEHYRDQRTGLHVPYRQVGFAGTVRYCSLNAHQGYQQSRRDDMESLGYMFIYFLKGQLPWQTIQAKTKSEGNEQKLKMKQSLEISDLCEGLPAAFSEYLHICRTMKFEQEPAYSYLRNLFSETFRRYNFTSDGTFDWDVDIGRCKTYKLNENILKENITCVQ